MAGLGWGQLPVAPAWRVAPSLGACVAVASAGVAAGAVVCLITRWATGERRWDGGVAIAVPRGLSTCKPPSSCRD